MNVSLYTLAIYLLVSYYLNSDPERQIKKLYVDSENKS